jgi:fructose-1,6-bisphosphatase/inositol monophosphatase family enzyme
MLVGEILEIIETVAAAVRPNLSDPQYLVRASKVIMNKGEGHLAHMIDELAEQELVRTLEDHGFKGRLFSEEAGVISFGDDSVFLVSDPYCNTSLTFRGIRESAVTLYQFADDYKLIEGAIADMQMPRTLHISEGLGELHWTNGSKVSAACSKIDRLEDAAVVVSLLKPSRRAQINGTLIRNIGNLLTIDGGIVALRICAGELDAFVDALRGQPAYEALAYLLVQTCGGTVTDGSGNPVDWERLVEELQDGQASRQSIVAASTQSLHDEIMQYL